MTFDLCVASFRFRALDPVFLPMGKAANVFRGALGETLRSVSCVADCPGAKVCPRRAECAYARLFEPVLTGGPSGLADPPRPFVLRPQFQGGRLDAGASIAVNVHLFDLRSPFVQALTTAFSSLVDTGLGPGRGRALLEHVRTDSLRLALEGSAERIDRLVVEFETPTELKVDGSMAQRPEFAVLAARVRDRIASLNHLYGSALVEFDWRRLDDAAREVRLVRADLEWSGGKRYSTRTGQVHPLGGFRGAAEYEGNLAPFLGLLRAGEWTGVGRQTVWGKGAYRVRVIG
jgi:hypothetical protein